MTEKYGVFAQVYDALMDDVDYDKWAAYIQMLLESCGLMGRLRIAEAACGTGSVSVRLAKNHDVVASDISQEMLEQASRKCREAGMDIKLICQDMRRLELHGKADAVISCCDGVNYLRKDDDALLFFSAARKALRPGGCLLFDISSGYKLSNTLDNAFFGEDREDLAYLWQNSYDARTKLMQMDLSLFLPRGHGLFERFRETHVQRAYGEKEISAMLEDSGFDVHAVYECFTTEPPLPRSPRIQFVAVAKEDQKRYKRK